MNILGLTGSIGMGKSTTAAIFRRLGVPVHDADAAVHRLMAAGGGGVEPVSARFPGCAVDGVIDRKALGRIVFADARALYDLEDILHPLVRQSERAFLRLESRRRRALAVLDIPLLFETGGEARCDAVCVVTAPPFVQARRVLRRPGMTREAFDRVLARQAPDAEKRRLADFVVQTGLGRHHALQQVREIVRLMSMAARGRAAHDFLGRRI